MSDPRAPTPLARRHSTALTTASASCAVGRHQGSARSTHMRSLASRLTSLQSPSSVQGLLCVVNIVRRLHTVANAASGSCALSSYVCAQRVVLDPDAWGTARQTWKRSRVHAAQLSPTCFVCFEAFLAFGLVALCMLRMRMPSTCDTHARRHTHLHPLEWLALS